MLKKQYITYLLFSGVLLLLSGCQSSKTIYYWEGYQENLYNYNLSDKSSHSEQIKALEKTIEKAKSANKPIPPGLHAHLGLLYTTVGNNNKAMEQFELEKSLFPESKNFIEFVEHKYQGH
ncbi:DUF4810 domain-containing protein [Gilliamella sp. B2840]|uniref:DUF4810 domain-containing protein n=1 Tax=unclassified Gilliamella TaxID=2685620 RepID=UPI00226996FB|nr:MULTISPECIES: DUF4810 domain-containing protein [unclassified Gilliamella]MCX8655471.1 DUF4810 domain-containing protein [Gilliamella sp. B2894]MCX8664236.1 DUF4810 domain-containing protein [Gilliamella sp. B2887]MCX8694943.1 DUF4810 domain-containing protein [Gilliamella sp. B2881]MCX8695471.1 DUF4810 domain-containing protein [Gilliamella sp. B2828]MCX8698738.1 DUF4810 domain-containing protein [Gilliamella sp. B3000]